MTQRRWIKRCKNRTADQKKWVQFRWGPVTIGCSPGVMRRVHWDLELRHNLRMAAEQYRRVNKL